VVVSLLSAVGLDFFSDIAQNQAWRYVLSGPVGLTVIAGGNIKQVKTSVKGNLSPCGGKTILEVSAFIMHIAKGIHEETATTARGIIYA
jgi:hypothetical protein